ncbi:MAG: M6 family metalloprotease domain-containing protein, partial [Candidatus Krumholzibacteria bacterium]|nr:M6 family metalloprotease domain-containing protein [Candidatus Krumholzibacteria bacterium]
MKAYPDPIVVQQPDGSEVTIYLKGDEYLNWNEDETGFPVVRSEDGQWWVYAREEMGRFVPTSYIVGRVDPLSVGLSKPDIERMRSTIQQAPRLQQDKDGPHKVPPTGTMRNLVLLVNFSDLTITRSTAEFESLFNTSGYAVDGAAGSVKDYYTEASYGALTVQSTVTDAVTLSHGYAYYDPWPYVMVQEALAALEARGFDFSTMDGDGDGWVDGLTVIHAGGGQEYAGNDVNYIWSHYGSLAGTVTYDGVRMLMYHTEPARRGWDAYPSTWGITRIGVICHENGHFIGLPDLYDYGYDSEGAGHFCLMAGGSSNGDSGTKPAHMSAWCKAELGWLTPTLITVGGSFSLSQVETVAQSYKLQGPFASTQYFLIENRQGTGFDSGLPGTQKGILIWHVDETQPNNNDQTHYKVDLEEASGTQHLALHPNEGGNPGDDYDYFRSGNANDFMESTTPNNLSYAGVPLGLNIAGVSATGSTMSFAIVYTISGFVKTAGGQGVPNVQMHVEDEGEWETQDGLTNSNGFYEVRVEGHWTGRIVPIPPACNSLNAFDPAYLAYSEVTADSSEGNDFTAYHSPRLYVGPGMQIAQVLNCAQAGDTIVVLPGDYYESNIVLKDDVVIMSESNDPNDTALHATGSTAISITSLQSYCLMKGFKIVGGDMQQAVDRGAEISSCGANCRIQFNNCLFQNCGTGGEPSTEGTAIQMIGGGKLIVTDCTFDNNHMTSPYDEHDEAAVRFEGGASTAEFYGCYFGGNEIAIRGTADTVIIDGCHLSLNHPISRVTSVTGNEFVRINDCRWDYNEGQIILLLSGPFELAYTVIANNTVAMETPEECDLVHWNGNGAIRNCTIAYNQAPTYGDSYCLAWDASHADTLDKNIIAFNSANTGMNNPSNATHAHNCLQGNQGQQGWQPLCSLGTNFCTDPMLCGGQPPDYHISALSPCGPQNPAGLIGAYGIGCVPPCTITMIPPPAGLPFYKSCPQGDAQAVKLLLDFTGSQLPRTIAASEITLDTVPATPNTFKFKTPPSLPIVADSAVDAPDDTTSITHYCVAGTGSELVTVRLNGYPLGQCQVYVKTGDFDCSAYT